MKRLLSPRFIAFLFALLWAAGTIAIWFLMPYGPRDGWQPPEDEFAVGLLSDSRTLVTIPRSENGKRDGRRPETGPVHLWDIETGNLRASHFGRGDQFVRVRTNEHRDWLLVSQRDVDDRNLFSLRIHDAWTGRTIANLMCHGPAYGIPWEVTNDGQMVVVGGIDNGNRPFIACYSIPSGRLYCTFPDCFGPFCFSANGRRLAATLGQDIVVFDVQGKSEVFHIAGPPKPSTPISSDFGWPEQLSPDGTLLLDSHCHVWDVNSGKLKFESPGAPYDSSLLTPDGKELAVATRAGSTYCSLLMFDLSTCEERTERRSALLGGDSPRMILGPWTPDGRLLLAEGESAEPNTALQNWLAKLPFLSSLAKPRWHGSFVVIEAATGRELVRGNSRAWCCTRDGRYVLSRSDDEVYKLWDIPARKPLRWLLPAFAIWTAVLTSLACWLGARAGRRASHAGPSAVK